MVPSYTLNRVILIIGGFRIHGFAPDDAITWDNQEESELQVGADGEVSLSLSADKSRIGNISVQPTSPSYRIMAQQARLQKQAVGQIAPLEFTLRDLQNGDRISDPNAVYLNLPAPNKNKRLAPVVFRIALPSPNEVFGALIPGI